MKNTPKLRFPEFQNDGEWEEKPLQNIADFVNKKISLSVLSPKKYISTENILQDFAGLKETNTLPPSGSATEFLVNDILVSNIRPYLKKICVAEFDGGASNDVIVIRASAGIHRHFLSYILKNDAFIDFVMAGAKGVKMPRGDTALIKQYPVLVPQESKEQQKIADCLCSVDELITAQSAKVEALKAHKKALMQQLFPTEGETTPRLRFPEFKNAPEWEEKKLYELNIYISDGNYGEMYPKSEEMKSSGIPFIRANNIKEQKLVLDDMKYIDAALHDKLTSGHLKKDDILVTTRGEIGTIAYVTNEFEGANINAQICLLRCDESLNSFFIMQYLASNNGSRQFRELETGSALKQLPKKNLGKVKVSISPLLSEQQKIADCLCSVDELITAQSAKVEALKQHKKALMQQLFPSAKEL